ncbi:tetratricopeptide repeat protein [Marilutibacter maris]|uniref:VWFA domain-containing protein n=1 Tax=Marilutibacter maris TaxID=1605891 RepID=A0A2U9TBX9_9GAMM|nr:tetratricopeptide repeat protein [Lysobacter maris]AWV08364.1 hypothetical protein C9I47_2688 [Lysobacter maris]
MTLPDLSSLHLLRPDWLWALSLLPVLAAVWALRRRRDGVWREAVDAHLLPHLLDRGDRPRRRWVRGLGALAGMLAYALAVLAMTGPSWRQVEQPLWQGKLPLVMALDLSSAGMAADPPPSRVAQARAKLGALLAARDGPVGLLVYADDAFTVAPITDDAANVALFLDALSPDIMPVDGQRADRALAAAVRLMQQAGFEKGRILLLAGEADERAVEAAGAARAAGFDVAVLGLGRRGGIMYRDVAGRTAVAGFDEASLRRVAGAGGGRYARLSSDASDLRALAVLDGGGVEASPVAARGGSTWLDEGFWLIPPVMLLVLLAFRRGAVLAMLLVGLWLPLTPAHAADWWRRADQLEHRRLSEAGDAYRKGDFAAAAEGYQQVDSADGHYNRGNALAKAGRYPEAVEAYDRALQLQPGMEDAIANREAVQAAMQQQQQPQSDGEDQDSGDSGDDDGSGSDGGERPDQGPADPSRQPGGDSGDGQTDASPESGENPGSDAGEGQEGAGPETGEDASPAPSPQDSQTQEAADEAQRRRMQQALEQEARQEDGDAQDRQSPAPAPGEETAEQRERRIANEAWLRRVPDDPGGLLREKFRIEHERRQRDGGAGGPKP